MSEKQTKRIDAIVEDLYNDKLNLRVFVQHSLDEHERVQELEKENQLLYGKLNNIRDEINRKIGE